MHTAIHYIDIKPDSRPDGTAIRDHARVRVLHVIISDTERFVSNIYDAIHARAVLDAMAMALSNLNTALADLL